MRLNTRNPEPGTRNPLFPAAAAAALLLVLAPPARADRDERKAEIRALFEQMAAGDCREDLKALEALIHPAAPDREKEKFLALHRSRHESFEGIALTVRDLSIEVLGQEASVVLTGIFTGMSEETGDFIVDDLSTSLFTIRRDGDAWKIAGESERGADGFRTLVLQIFARVHARGDVRALGKEAEGLATQAAALLPTAPLPRYLKAVSFLAQEDGTAAVRELDAALLLDAAFWPARELKGKVLLHEKRLGQAEDEFKEALKVAPTSAALYMDLARVTAERGDGEKALAVLQEGLAKAPSAGPLYFSVYANLRDRGQKAEVQRHFLEQAYANYDHPAARQQILSILQSGFGEAASLELRGVSFDPEARVYRNRRARFSLAAPEGAFRLAMGKDSGELEVLGAGFSLSVSDAATSLKTLNEAFQKARLERLLLASGTPLKAEEVRKENVTAGGQPGIVWKVRLTGKAPVEGGGERDVTQTDLWYFFHRGDRLLSLQLVSQRPDADLEAAAAPFLAGLAFE